MKRNDLNFLIDAVSFVLFSLLAASGVILHFILPPRSGQNSLLWMTRHQWGELHFWIAAVFLLIISIHLVIHWRWITAMLFRRLGRQN